MQLLHRRIGNKAVSLLYAACLASGVSSGSAKADTSPLVSFNTLPALQVSTPIPGSMHVPGDFDGNGTSDLLWFNPELSQVGYWLMSSKDLSEMPSPSPLAENGVTRISLHAFDVTPGYFVGAIGDFNNDAYSDIVFTSANRDLWLWTNNRHGGFISQYIGTYPSGWQLIGAGDIDGDGYDDLLWLSPSTCQFGFWAMHGNIQTGLKTMPIACGYYPISIGYYSPVNRLSILWTNPNNDFYIWDSREDGFKAYRLDASKMWPMSQNAPYMWIFGGGYEGQNIGMEICGTGPFDYSCQNRYVQRVFDENGDQVDMYAMGGNLTFSRPYLTGSAGYIIKGGNSNASGLYFIDQSQFLIKTGGISDLQSIYSGNAPSPISGQGWTYPEGWYVVGAPANNTFTPPWQ